MFIRVNFRCIYTKNVLKFIEIICKKRGEDSCEDIQSFPDSSRNNSPIGKKN